MAGDLKPHTPEWFEALRSSNSLQAAATKQVIDLAGTDEVCSVCGDDPATDYRVTPSETPGTMRLCDDCRDIRRQMHGEEFEPL